MTGVPLFARKIYICWLSVVVCVAGCATRHESQLLAPPIEWLAQFEPMPDQCKAINEIYRNLGERYIEEGRVVADAMLAEMVFSRFLPGGFTSEFVRIRTDAESNDTEVTLIGKGNRELRFDTSCESGWYLIKHSRRNQYLGDGVQETRYEKSSFFRLGKQGELIATVRESAQLDSLYLMQSDAEARGWYRFWPARDDESKAVETRR